MKRLLLPVVAALIPLANASAGGFEIAGLAGRALPSYQQSFRYSPTLSGLPRGASLQQEGAFSVDARGGLAIGGVATWYFAGPLGLEGRVDSVEVKADITGARFSATAALPPLPPVTGSVDFPAGVVSVDRLRPLSLNLKLRTPGAVRLTVSGGASYLPELKAQASQAVGLGVTGLAGGRLQVAALSLSASTESTQAGRQGKLGVNAGVGLQIALGSRLALVAEGRGFLFKKRRLLWGVPAGRPLTALEAALLGEVLKRLDPLEFNPASYQATAGLALSF